MIDYTKINRSTWTPEQIAAHCKAIGADKPPDAPRKGPTSTTAPYKLNGSSHYARRGGEW